MTEPELTGRIAKLLRETLGGGTDALESLDDTNLCALIGHCGSWAGVARHVGRGSPWTSEYCRRRLSDYGISTPADARVMAMQRYAELVEPRDGDDEGFSKEALLEHYRRVHTSQGVQLSNLRNAHAVMREIIAVEVDALPPVKPKFTIKTPTSVDEELCELHLSDIHVGEWVHAADTAGLNRYDWDVFMERRERLIERFDSVLNGHIRNTYPVKHCLVQLYGDMCLTPGQLVTMYDGSRVPIEEVPVLSHVLTHTGSKGVVYDRFVREIDEEMVHLDLHGDDTGLTVTDEHPILGITREMIWTRYCAEGRSDRGRAITTNIMGGWPVFKRHWDCVSERDLQFIPAQELSEGDYVAVPVGYISGESEVWVDLPDGRRSRRDCPDRVRLDCDLARILGYYAAEGWCDEHGNQQGRFNRVVFAMGCPEGAKERIEDLERVLCDKFGVPIAKRNQAEKQVQLTVTNCRVAGLFADLCGVGSENKRAPVGLLVDAGPSVVASFLAGYMGCDGHLSNTKNDKALITVSVSRGLIDDCRFLLHGIGLQCAVNTISQHVGCKVQYRLRVPGNDANELTSFGCENKQLELTTASKSRRRKIGDYWLVPITGVGRTKYTGPVYNLGVSTDESYVVNGVAVHNCTGENIFSGQAFRIDQFLLEQIVRGSYQIADLIRYLASTFETVRVLSVPGNHGRMAESTMNSDVLFYMFMKQYLREQENVTVNISETSPFLGYYLDGDIGILDWSKGGRRHNHLMGHGNQVQSYYGTPYYGLDRIVGKLNNLFGVVWDRTMFGHFHIEGKSPNWMLCPSWLGATSYTVGKLQAAARPAQLMNGFHPRQGMTWQYTLWLDEAPKLQQPAVGNIYTPVDGLVDPSQGVVAGRGRAVEEENSQ